MKTILLAIFASAFVLISASAGAEEYDLPIDAEMHAALKKAENNAQFVQAYAMAQREWNQEMKRIYKQLQRKMKPEEWRTFRAAQNAWLSFRETQYRALGVVHGNTLGTMWRPIKASQFMEITRARVLFLEDLLE